MLPGFDERRKALEDAFFRDLEKKQLAALRDAQKTRESRELMRDTVGIENDAVLDKLLELGLTADTAVAITLVPLVAVAWADGTVHEKERAAVLRAAAENGIEADNPAHDILEGWLQRQPPDALLDAWSAYTHALVEQLPASERAALRDLLVERARHIASAAGGFLGVKSISAAEEARLADIAKPFA